MNALATLVDKNAIMQVIGSLVQNPLLFSEIGIKGLTVADFDSRFTRSIFMAIINLVNSGAETLTIVDIDNYLQGQPVLYSEFTKQNGIGYLQDCYDLANLENFQYYYKRVKKFTALRQLKLAGVNIADIYPESEDDVIKEKKLLDAFDNMSVSDIFNHIQTKIQKIQYDFTIINANSQEAGTGLRELVEQLKVVPEIGYPLQGTIFNNISRGARRGKFYLNSGSSGSGKTRTMVGDACFLAFPHRWDSVSNKWKKTDGGHEKVLILTTELTSDEVQTIILANLTNINEEKILYGAYTKEEEQRIKEAIDIIEGNPNLFIESIPDPGIAQIKAIIKRQVAMNKVNCVFYDYIFSSPNLLTEFRDISVREDVLLMLLSTALKDLAVELNIFIESGTQLSGDYETWKGIRNQTLIRSSKAIVDKVDLGVITMPVRQDDLNMLDTLLKNLNMPNPTHVRDVYKLRRGRYKNVRIWCVIDLGTGRVEDLFMTNGNYEAIQATFYQTVFEDLESIYVEEEAPKVIENNVEPPKIEEYVKVVEAETKVEHKKTKRGWDSC